MNKQVISLMEEIEKVNGEVTNSFIDEDIIQGRAASIIKLHIKGGYLFDITYFSSTGMIINSYHSYLEKIEAPHIIDFLLDILSLELKLKEPKTLKV